MSRLVHGIIILYYAHTRFDDLDLDARFGSGLADESIQHWINSTTERAMSMLGYVLFHTTLTLKTFIWLGHLVVNSHRFGEFHCGGRLSHDNFLKNIIFFVMIIAVIDNNIIWQKYAYKYSLLPKSQKWLFLNIIRKSERCQRGFSLVCNCVRTVCQSQMRGRLG